MVESDLVYQPVAVNNVAGAFVKAQAEFPPIPKNKNVKVRTDKGTYEYAYADLPSIMAAVTPVLAKYKLGIIHRAMPFSGGVRVVTMLVHESGQSITSDLTMETKQGSPQAIGSLLSYAKRYNVSLILGLAAEEDDDGAIAQGLGGESKVTPRVPKNTNAKPGSATQPPPKADDVSVPNPQPTAQDQDCQSVVDPVTGAQLKTMFTLLTNKGYDKSDLKSWLDGHGLKVASSKDIPKSWANKILEWIDGLESKRDGA